MSEEIKAGDLVVVVKASLCCNGTKTLGKIFKVESVREVIGIKCLGCGNIEKTNNVRAVYKDLAWHLSRLKKINPSTEPEHVETQQEITA